VIASAVALATFALFGYRAWVIPGGTDAEAYYNAALRAASGAPLYFASEATPFKYLPPVAYFLIPLSWIPFAWARMAIFLISWLIAARLYRGLLTQYGGWVALLVFVAMARFHNHDFLNLQINHWVLGLFVLFTLTRKTRPWVSAFAFSGMALFKFTPLVLLVPLLAMGRFREILRILVAITVLAAIPVALHPDHLQIYSEWYALVKATTPWPAPDFSVVQSVQAALWYVLQGRVSPEAFSGAVGAVGVIAVLGLAAVARRAKTPRAEILVLCAAAVPAVIFSPLAWKHVYVLLWPAAVAVVVERRWKTYGVVIATMSVGPGLIALFSKHLADRSYITVAGATVICVSLLAAMRLESGMASGGKKINPL